MSQQNTPNPTLEAIRLLRESGHHEAAAELATNALEQAATTTPPGPTGEPKEQAHAANGAFAADNARRAEGQAMLDQMRRQGIGPAQPEPTEDAA